MSSSSSSLCFFTRNCIGIDMMSEIGKFLTKMDLMKITQVCREFRAFYEPTMWPNAASYYVVELECRLRDTTKKYSIDPDPFNEMFHGFYRVVATKYAQKQIEATYTRQQIRIMFPYH